MRYQKVPGCGAGSGLSAIVRNALREVAVVAVVLPVAPAVAMTPSHTPKPPPKFVVDPTSVRSVRLVRLAFVSALNAFPFASRDVATAPLAAIMKSSISCLARFS